MRFNRYKHTVIASRVPGLSFFQMPVYGKGYKSRVGRKDDLRAKGKANVMVSVCSWFFDDQMYITSKGRTAVMYIGQKTVHLSKLELRRSFWDCVLRPSPAANRKSVRRELDLIAEQADHLDVIVDSPGGEPQSYLGVAQALKSWRHSKRLLIDGQCSSAATLILCVPHWDSVCITARSSIQIHASKSTTYAKRSGAFRILGEQRGTSTRKFERLYIRRTGRKPGEIMRWMDENKRFTAPEACMVGFADEMLPRTDWEKGR